MKKVLMAALCVSIAGTMSAQKEVVDQASKLSGKIDKVEEARSLIKQAEADPSTANDVRTYYVAGKIEYDAFDKAYQKRGINPDDPEVNVENMGAQLVNGYNMFLKALPLDSVPDEKGKIKAKHSKEMINKINGHFADYYNYAGELFNAKHYYPNAYNAFMVYGDLPGWVHADKNIQATADTVRALAYYYAGIAAFSGNELPAAAVAFAKARENNITDPQSYVYEIATWQNLANRDSTMVDKAKSAIELAAKSGFDRFGIANPLFLNNLVNAKVQENKYADAIAIIDSQIAKTPNEPFLYGLRAFVSDRNDNDADAEAFYRKAASFDNADAETLVNAAKKIYNIGSQKWNVINGGDATAKADVRTNYWEVAKSIAERAQTLDPSNPSVDYILENINYALETYK